MNKYKNEGKRITKVIEYQTADKETGEIIDRKTTSYTSGRREPDFIKVYLRDMMYVLHVQGVSVEILLGLCSLMDYQARIVLNRAIKTELAQDLKIKINTLEQAVSKLVRAGVFMRKDTGLYNVNPFYLAKGQWEDISEMRMMVKYNALGVAVSMEYDKSDPIDQELEKIKPKA